jgi:predicted dehydrogenase
MKYLIAGFGSIGRRHFQNLLAQGEQDILFLRSHRSTLPDDELAGYPVETELEAALAHKPDAVIVANPTALHLDVAILAARQGCHLFLEKPVSHSIERIDELTAAVAEGSGQVFTGFQFRFHPGLERICEMIEDREFGRVLSVRAHWGEYLPDWHPWEDFRQGYSARPDLGGGVVLTLCHPLDYMRWLFGEVEALWAFTGSASPLDQSVEDVAEIGLRFAGGLTGSLHLDYFQRPPSHTLEIIFEHASLRWDYTADGDIHIHPARDDQPQFVIHMPLGYERNDMFVDEMAHFVRVVRGEEKPLCTLQDGIMALQLALAVHRSNETGEMIRIEA